MVSTQTSYLRGMSPPKYRRQTLQVFDVYADHKSDYAQLPPRPASALDKKWVHRSLGDLTSDTDFMNSHPRLQTNFYQDLIRKYPQAFTRRREARDTGRKLFNSRPHVRFEEDEKPLTQKSRSVLTLYKGDDQLTNWDREVGPYIRKNNRECLTSVDPSECSGSVLSLKQRLHINSLTLNRLLNEKSPLRKKFERDRTLDDSGTENEQSLEDYFLDKSRRRSRNRVKHRRVLQRKIDNNTNNNEQERQTSHRRWMSRSVSPTHRNMYSLPTQNTNSTIDHGSKSMDVDSVMRNSDLKIDTLLERISSKLTGPESPPDSAIDVDTPSVQSFVSSEKVMTSDNVYHVSIDLDDKAGDFESESSPESSPSVYASNKSGRSHDDTSANVKNSAMNTNHSISRESQILVSINDDSESKLKGSRNDNYDINADMDRYLEGPGLLQLYSNQMRPDLNNRLHQPIEQFTSHMTNSVKVGLGNAAAGDASSPRIPEDDRKWHHGNQDINEEWASMNESKSALPPRGRHKIREATPSMIQTDHRLHPNRTDLDSCILDEIQLDKLSHDLHGRHPHTDNIDDTDVRLGIPKITSQEAKIAEKYRRTRSPSPFVLKNHRLSLERPKSAPLLSNEGVEIRIVDIPFTGESGINNHPCDKPNTPVEVVTWSVHETCQRNDIYSDDDNDNNASSYVSEVVKDNGVGVKKKSCVQTCDSKILVSSSQIKQRNSIAMVTDSVENSDSSTEGGNSVIEKDMITGNFIDGVNKNSDLDPKHNPERDLYDKRSTRHTTQSDKPESDDYVNPQTNGNPATYATPKTNRNLQTSVNLNKQMNGNPHTNESVDSYVNPGTQIVTSKRGIYKPSASSPSTNDKKFKLKSLLKSKKGSFSPAPPDDLSLNPRDVQLNNASLSDDPLVSHTDIPDNRYTNRPSSTMQSPSIGSHETSNSERLEDSESESDLQTIRSKSIMETGLYEENIPQANKGNSSSIPIQVNIPPANRDSNSPSPAQINIPPANRDSCSSNPEDIPLVDRVNNSTGEYNSQDSLPRSTNLPPVKPARLKHKKLPNALDLSSYKITPNGQEQLTTESNPQHDESNRAAATQPNIDFREQDENRWNQGKPPQRPNDPSDCIERIGPQTSNLEASKAMSASKGSLFGGFKSATKGKLKSLRKAMSLERGMDKAGVVSFPDPNNQVHMEADNNTGNAKMKKAPSLKSIASLFGRRKKKKGKLNFEETQSSSQSISSSRTGSSDSPQSRIAHPKPVTSTSRPIGKLRTLNADGTQIIQLMKPASGPIGFFIAKGSAKFKNGIFISRFADPQPEKVFGGLLSIGDEILEVNGHFVRDLSQDDVYDIISASPIVVMKVFPFIARKDV